MRSVVYTAIFGGYDHLTQPVAQDCDCDFICFTDQRMPARVGLWNVIHVRTRPGLHPRLQAKRFKVLSHQTFPGGRLSWRHRLRRGGWFLWNRYAWSIWIDGHLAVKSPSFVRDVSAAAAGTGWAVFAHPDRDCIFEEATLCETIPKCRGLPVIEQVEAYGRAGIARHGGLYACGVIARREPTGYRLRRVNRLWWKEIARWTYRDQLSLPYVLKKAGAEVGIIPGSLWKNEWFDCVEHRSES